MKKLIPAALFCIVFANCRKNFINKQESPAPITAEVVDIPCEDNEDELGGEFLSEATFPGGKCAWQQYIRQHLTYPDELLDANVQGEVLVRFMINTKGEITDVEAVKGPQELRQSAVDVIKKSPKWIPGVMNGRAIKCYKTQPISFRLDYE